MRRPHFGVHVMLFDSCALKRRRVDAWWHREDKHSYAGAGFKFFFVQVLVSYGKGRV